MRIYVSGAISGVENYKDAFDKAEEQLKADGHVVINPTKVEQILINATYEEYMSIDMFLLSMCDAIYMLPGWQQSRGANREYGYALAKGFIILEEVGDEIYKRQ